MSSESISTGLKVLLSEDSTWPGNQRLGQMFHVHQPAKELIPPTNLRLYTSGSLPLQVLGVPCLKETRKQPEVKIKCSKILAHCCLEAESLVTEDRNVGRRNYKINRGKC